MQTIESELSSSSRYSRNKEDIKSVNSITAVTTTVIVAMTMENSSRHLTWEGGAISNSKDSRQKDLRNKNIQDLMLQLTTTLKEGHTKKKLERTAWNLMNTLYIKSSCRSLCRIERKTKEKFCNAVTHITAPRGALFVLFILPRFAKILPAKKCKFDCIQVDQKVFPYKS